MDTKKYLEKRISNGPLFGTNGEMTIGLNSTWEVYEEGTW